MGGLVSVRLFSHKHCDPTYHQAFHLLLAQHIYTKCLANLVVELVRPASRGHDTQLPRMRSVAHELGVAQVLHELDAVVDPVGLEVLEVEAAAGIGGIDLAREVY